MTKIAAIKSLMADYNGVVNWQIIYNEIEKYYPAAKQSSHWQAGLRGVLYREEKNGTIKRIEEGVFALTDFNFSHTFPNELGEELITEKISLQKLEPRNGNLDKNS